MVTPTISVIMAFHNNESTIEKSLKSVLNQSYKNFELLIMDDFSQDDSLNLVKKLNDKRIKLFSNNENLGLTKSLNILSNPQKAYNLERIKNFRRTHQPHQIFSFLSLKFHG